jgi:hypothetical protein
MAKFAGSMLQSKKYFALITVVFSLVVSTTMGQGRYASDYLFHLFPFKQVQPNIPTNKRSAKTRIEAGMVLGFLKNDPHYTNTSKVSSGYTIGVKEEIPVLRKSAIQFGFDFYKQSISFNSYFFAPGYSFLYDPAKEIYNHAISIDEMHFPIELRFSFLPETKNIRTFYGMFGYVYRLLIYDNAIVTNTQSGRFVYEGQDNLTYNYSLFTPKGSSIIELGLGYQRNGMKNGNAFFVELNYNYGISPINYSGNGFGSNDINFTLASFAIKVGLKI